MNWKAAAPLASTFLLACAIDAGDHAAKSSATVETGVSGLAQVNLNFGQPCPLGATCVYEGARESAPATISCATGTLSRQSATYLVPGAGSENCSPYVSRCNGTSSCEVVFGNENCGGDPDYGVVKSGTATVTCEQLAGQIVGVSTDSSGNSFIEGWACSELNPTPSMLNLYADDPYPQGTGLSGMLAESPSPAPSVPASKRPAAARTIISPFRSPPNRSSNTPSSPSTSMRSGNTSSACCRGRGQ